MVGGCGLVTRIILGGVCDNINVRLEENDPEEVLEPRAERERERILFLHVLFEAILQ